MELQTSFFLEDEAAAPEQAGRLRSRITCTVTPSNLPFSKTKARTSIPTCYSEQDDSYPFQK